MKNIFCCYKGGASRAEEEPPELPQLPPLPQLPQPPQLQAPPEQGQPSEPEQTFDNNEWLNFVWTNKIELPDDRNRPDSQPPSPHPLTSSGVTFLWGEIESGTQNFRRENLLGQGTFGEVFRCDLPNDNIVGAAKIERSGNPFSHSEFIAEVTILHRANHPNVIKLIGKCFGREHCAIVYQLMPRRSLNLHIFDQEAYSAPVLNWEKRMKIAVGIAEALVYLHQSLKVIHRDVKVSNILLDDDFNPKLTDFGLAIDMVEEEDGTERVQTIRPIKGTPGCVAPETEQSGLVSTKSDVYSYGVLLYVLFTGKKASDFKRPPGKAKIIDWLMPVWTRTLFAALVVDIALGHNIPIEGLFRLFSIAKACTHPDPDERPNMETVKKRVREAALFQVPEWPPMERSLTR